MKKVHLLKVLLMSVVMSIGFASCEKDEIVVTGITYDLEGTTWKSTWLSQLDFIASFQTEKTGEIKMVWKNNYVEATASFTYTLNGSYGVYSCTTLDGNIDDFYTIIPCNAEIHLIDKNTLSIGGVAFTRQ